jgi:5S rRNA maturation endonuclease (ribonuclease M5)
MAADFSKLAEQYSRRISQRQVRLLAQSLGVTAASLVRLDVGFDGEAFCFPMRDASGAIIGIRRRFGNGQKVCVCGSQNGLFIPAGIDKAVKVVICEGPTDCAAALDLGWDAIGRPNCDSKIAMTVRYIRQRKAVIVADRDSAGLRGARKLYEALETAGSAVRIIVPPDGCKDLRDWKRRGVRVEL